MEDLEVKQPVSIHGPGGAHPVAIAVAVIFAPILLALVVGGLVLVNLAHAPETETSSDLGQASELLKKHAVSDAVARQAVCNDGSPAVYYLGSGTPNNSQNWVVFLEGGGGICDSDVTCAERFLKDKQRVTSTGYPENLAGQGFLSPSQATNPDFFGYNHVYVKYCSSDSWSGDTEHTIDGKLAEFRGQKIVAAVLEDLKLAPGADVFLTGNGQGGLGVAHNLDALAEAHPDVHFHGLAAEAWEPALPASTASLDYPSVVSYLGSQLDSSCLAAHVDDNSSCYRLDASYPFISAPLFITTEQTGPDLETSLANVSAAFAPKPSSLSISGHTLNEVVGNWYFSRPGPTKLIEE